MKMKKLVAAVALTLGLPVAAHAGITFDANGALAGEVVTNVGAFDWGPTSLFALDGNRAIANFVGSGGACPAGSCNFDLMTHARLVGFIDPDGNSLANPSGLNSAYEITMIARYTEVVTGVTGTTVEFATVPAAGGFLEIYFDSTPDSIDVAGYGFNDGNLILSGSSVQDGSSVFVTTAATSPLDGTGANDYDGQLTRNGFGGSDNIAIDTLTQDSAFFKTTLAMFGIQFANISLGLPYVSVNPSDCFTGVASGIAVPGGGTAPNAGCTTLHVDGLMSAQDVPGAGYYRPIISGTNATVPTIIAGVLVNPDFIAQSDFNSPLAAAPEPGSLALLGLGLGLAGLGARRKMKR